MIGRNQGGQEHSWSETLRKNTEKVNDFICETNLCSFTACLTGKLPTRYQNIEPNRNHNNLVPFTDLRITHCSWIWAFGFNSIHQKTHKCPLPKDSKNICLDSNMHVHKGYLNTNKNYYPCSIHNKFSTYRKNSHSIVATCQVAGKITFSINKENV